MEHDSCYLAPCLSCIDAMADADAEADAADAEHCADFANNDPIPCCPGCWTKVGGANGSDARPCNDGEPCGAADCDGDPRSKCECCEWVAEHMSDYDGGAVMCGACQSAARIADGPCAHAGLAW